MACDRHGTERDQQRNEASTIIGPDGWIRATVGRSRVARPDLDLGLSSDKRLPDRNDLLADRRRDR